MGFLINKILSLCARFLKKDAYKTWINNEEVLLWRDVNNSSDIIVSIVVPVYNSKPIWLIEAVDSVCAQTYQNWELILVDDASDKPGTQSTLKLLEQKFEKVQVVWRDKNGHISEATNTGIDIAIGDFIVLLDHDDLLAPQALNELVCTIQDNPDVRFIYSDEDLMTEAGRRVVPHFKSDLNPDLLRSHNYITHLSCYRRDLMSQLGGARAGFEGAQDYDLVLRTMEFLAPNEVQHISKILYHWRMVEGSTAKAASSKNYATEAGLKALQDHLDRTCDGAVARHAKHQNFYRISWPLPETLPMVSIIIPSRDGLDVLRPCLESIAKTINYENLEVVIVDNGSSDSEALAYLQSIRKLGKISYLQREIEAKIIVDDGGFNFSRLINLGASEAQGSVLLLLNNDIAAIESGWFEEMLAHACRPDIGCVGAKLLYPDLTIQHAGVILGLGGYAAHSHRGIRRNDSGYFNRAQTVQNFSAVTAACLMVRRDIFQKVDGFDECFAVAYNDVDYCLRVMQAGWRNLYTPGAELVHHESKTRGSDTTHEKKQRFDTEKAKLLERWPSMIDHDPYYNPNLTRSRENFSIR